MKTKRVSSSLCGLLGILLLASAAHAELGDPGAESGDSFGMALARGDFNGDGYEDLAVGVPSEDVNGRPIAPEDQTMDPIELALERAGAVEVIYGTASGLASDNRQFWRPGDGNVEGPPQGGDEFGRSLATGDFNHDGYADLAIGVPGRFVGGSGSAGAVYVLYGSALGLSAPTVARQVWHQGISALGDVAEYGDGFGSSLATGDFDHDGYADLAIGVRGEDIGSVPDAGAVNVIYGSVLGLSEFATAERRSFWYQGLGSTSRICIWRGDCVLDTPESYDHFSGSLAVGDFNGDGPDDLAIGVPDEDVGSVGRAGAVHVIYGSTLGLTTAGNRLWHQDSPDIEDGADFGDSFGESLATGDFNGDGLSDLAIGVPNESFGVPGRIGYIPAAGAVNVIYGSPFGLTAIGNQFWAQDSPDMADQPESEDHFGFSLAAGDFNGDGYADLAIGIPFEDVGSMVNAGAVNVLHGYPGYGLITALNQFWHQDISNVDGAGEPGDHFGRSLAAGKFNGASYSDLAVGIPFESLYSAIGSSLTEAGAVSVIYGSSPPFFTPGLNATTPFPDQVWTQAVVLPPQP